MAFRSLSRHLFSGSNWRRACGAGVVVVSGFGGCLILAEKKTDYYLPPVTKFAPELARNAAVLGLPGKGVLAADESTGTLGQRFASIKVENTQANRRAYRRMLFNAAGLSQYISGVILYDETLNDKDEQGVPLVAPLQAEGILLGIKVDKGLKILPGTDNETSTQGLDDLDTRAAKYYAQGCKFAKWRATIKIGAFAPSQQAIRETAYTLARYAAICQANGLVPVVEPEVLMDGDFPIEVCQYWTEKVLAACFTELQKQDVLLEGMVLKPNMILPGTASGQRYTTQQCAEATLTTLARTVPPAVPAILFLSGGQKEEEATQNLASINAVPGFKRPWTLSFSYGRALQQSCLRAWQGEARNEANAQRILLQRARANSMAQLGRTTFY